MWWWLWMVLHDLVLRIRVYRQHPRLLLLIWAWLLHWSKNLRLDRNIVGSNNHHIGTSLIPSS